MAQYWPYVAVPLALIALVVVWRIANRANRQRQREQAMPEFDARRNELAATFLQAAAATGKPRGLRWKSVDLSGPPLFALDRTGNLYALVGATISFEAIEGGGMEDVEAVGNLRSATAVFVHRGGEWTTDGRVIFNLEPQEALQRFEGALEPVGRLAATR